MSVPHSPLLFLDSSRHIVPERGTEYVWMLPLARDVHRRLRGNGVWHSDIVGTVVKGMA